MDFAVAVHNVYLTVIIKKHRAVVIKALNIALFPRTFRIFCGEVVGLMGVVGDENHMEHAIMIPQARRPHSVGVGVVFAV